MNLGSPNAPLLEIWKQAVIDATASHIFISAMVLPGHKLCTLSGLGCIRGYQIRNTHRRPKPNISCFGSSCLPSMKRSGRKDSGSSYILGFLVSPLMDILKGMGHMQIGGMRERYRPYICHDDSTLGNMISKILVIFGWCVGNPCRERKSAFITCETEKSRSIPKVAGALHLHRILRTRMEGSCRYYKWHTCTTPWQVLQDMEGNDGP